MAAPTTGLGSLKLYVKLGKLEGESSREGWKSKGFSDIMSFQISANASWNFDSGKSASGGVSFGGLTLTRAVVGGTPQLFIGCLKEKKMELVELCAGDDTGKEASFIVRLKGDVRISGCSISGDSGGQMLECISLQAPIIEVEHKVKSKKDDIDFAKLEQKNTVL